MIVLYKLVTLPGSLSLPGPRVRLHLLQGLMFSGCLSSQVRSEMLRREEAESASCFSSFGGFSKWSPRTVHGFLLVSLECQLKGGPQF